MHTEEIVDEHGDEDDELIDPELVDDDDAMDEVSSGRLKVKA